MSKKSTVQKLSRTIVCCASSLLSVTPAFALSVADQGDKLSVSTNFQASVEQLHHDLLLSDCHSANPEIHLCLDVLANRESSSSERCAAAAKLGGLKYMAQSSLLPLVRIFSSESDYAVKTAVAQALMRISPDVAVLQILSGIESRDEDYRQMCIATLSSGGKEVVPPLVKALKCPDGNIRRQSALALSELGATAITAVNALREISSNIDENSLFATQAAQSALSIKRDYDEKTGPDVAFNSESWKDERGRQYRFRMVHDLIERRTLIGLSSAQLHNLLGRGVSFFKGAQYRYALGSKGIASRHRNSQIAYSERSHNAATKSVLSARVSNETDSEQFLVVNLKDDVVTGCDLVDYDPELWNVNNLDRHVSALPKVQKTLPVLATASAQLRR